MQIPSALPQPYSSDLIYVRDAALGQPEGLEPPEPFRLLPARAASDWFAASATLTWQPSAHALSYRVAVSGAPDFAAPLAATTATRCSATLGKLPASRRLYWKVEAVSWGGAIGSAGPVGSFLTPPVKPHPGVTFASDLPWVRSSAGAENTVHRDTNYYGREIRIAGQPYPKGLWTHAFPSATLPDVAPATPADVMLDIADHGFAVFAADLGVEDAAGGGSVQFQVLVDGALRAKSPVMRPGASHPFRVDVSGAREVTLRVLNGGDGFTCDHSAWGLARFVAAGAQDPFAAKRDDQSKQAPGR